MNREAFQNRIECVAEARGRYDREAYVFTLEALNDTLEKRRNRGLVGHIRGQELLAGIREYALRNFGYLSGVVFETWGVRSTEDFGEIVFDLVSVGLLAKEDSDRKSDFEKGFNFGEAFESTLISG